MVALIELVEGLDHAARRVQETLALGVLADIGQQRLHRRFRLCARGARLVGADGGREEFGRVKLGRAALGLPVGGLLGRMDLIVASISTPFDGLAAGVSPADGAASRRTPEDYSFGEKGPQSLTSPAWSWITTAGPLDCFSTRSDPI
ncbi:hypothetical protein BRDID11004_28150 [Bradyrhizobium diazoefficiens]